MGKSDPNFNQSFPNAGISCLFNFPKLGVMYWNVSQLGKKIASLFSLILGKKTHWIPEVGILKSLLHYIPN